MAKIWKNRILAGTQTFTDCPTKYKPEVARLINEDITNGVLTKAELAAVTTAEEYEAITGEQPPENPEF